MTKCICNHEQRDHIYEEGACRPGFICPCEKFHSVDEPLIKDEYKTAVDLEMLIRLRQHQPIDVHLDQMSTDMNRRLTLWNSEQPNQLIVCHGPVSIFGITLPRT